MNTLENSCFQFQENDEASKKCIRIMNERYKSASPSLSDNFRGYDNHYYSIIDGMKNCDKNDHSRNEVVISPSDYLALLTPPKQLTVEDLKVGNRFECIEEFKSFREEYLFTKGQIYKCEKDKYLRNDTGTLDQIYESALNRHFILHSSQPETVLAQEELIDDGNNNNCEKWKIDKNELLPVQEEAKSIDTNYKLIPMFEITDEARKIAVRWGDNMKDDFISQKHKLASDIMNFSNQHTAHLQQQLKEANLLLLNIKNTIELNNIQKVFPETYPQINQFLTPCKSN